MLLELETIGGSRVLFPLSETIFSEESGQCIAKVHGFTYPLKYPYSLVKKLAEDRMKNDGRPPIFTDMYRIK